VRVRDVLNSVGARFGIGRAVEAGILWRRWREIVGPDVAGHLEPSSLRGGVLRVRADSPVWATEAGYLRDEIKARSNACVGAEVVAEVRVWTGPGAGVRPPVPGTGDRRRAPKPPARDAREAFARARRAWAERRSSRR
jgi:predicted nucleic acid-binding Zn ribbon protein